MNKLRFVTLFAMIITLSGCGGGVTIKDATSFVLGQTLSNSSDSDYVTVHDARIDKTAETIAINNNGTIKEVYEPVGHNWNNSGQQVTAPVNKVTPTVQVTQLPKDDKTYTLFTFFFAMMTMGMLGAGIIGIIEAFSGRNSLSTEQAVNTAPTQKVKPRIKLNNDGTIK